MEDKHFQLDQDKSLYHLDLILRTYEYENYIAFDLFNNEEQKMIFINTLNKKNERKIKQ